MSKSGGTPGGNFDGDDTERDTDGANGGDVQRDIAAWEYEAMPECDFIQPRTGIPCPNLADFTAYLVHMHGHGVADKRIYKGSVVICACCLLALGRWEYPRECPHCEQEIASFEDLIQDVELL